jgi:hypothetical protein
MHVADQVRPADREERAPAALRARPPLSREVFQQSWTTPVRPELRGERGWDRTSDPHDVNVVLSR